MLCIITYYPNNDKYKYFRKIKKWFLEQYQIRINAQLFVLQEDYPIINSLYDINGLDYEAILFIPKFAFPNLGAINFKKYLGKYLLSTTSSNNTNNEEVFMVSSSIFNKVRELILDNMVDVKSYKDLQLIFSILALESKNKSGIRPLKNTWNYDFKVNMNKQSKVQIEEIHCFNLINDMYNLDTKLNYIKLKLCDWSLLNRLRFRNVSDYINIFDYTGRNKLGCKEIAANYGVNVPKTYQVVDYIKEINWNKLPSMYVIKPTNLAGARNVYLIKDGIDILTGKKLDKNQLERAYKDYKNKQGEKELNKYLKTVLEPKIIIEELIIGSGSKSAPLDFKCYVFKGVLKFILVIDGQDDRQAFSFYDRNWNKIPNNTYCTVNKEVKKGFIKPKFLDKLVNNAEILAKSFQKLVKSWEGNFIRVDFFITDNDVYFGEFAIFPNGAKGKNLTKEGQIKFAEYLLDFPVNLI